MELGTLKNENPQQGLASPFSLEICIWIELPSEVNFRIEENEFVEGGFSRVCKAISNYLHLPGT